MTDPQRHKLVASGAVTVIVFTVLYLVIFGFQSFDPKGLVIGAVFFVMAWKISMQKHRRNRFF